VAFAVDSRAVFVVNCTSRHWRFPDAEVIDLAEISRATWGPTAMFQLHGFIPPFAREANSKRL
jgi:hypothetical protein